MSRREHISVGESPFLLEALEPFREDEQERGGDRAELVRQIANVSRRLSPGARRHLERALVRHLADAGGGSRGALAATVVSLRRMLRESDGDEAEALEVIDEEAPFLDAEGNEYDETEADEEEESPFLAGEALDEERDVDDGEYEDDEYEDDEAFGGRLELEDSPREGASAAAGERDTTIAVPAFSAEERARVAAPLLSAAKNANAARANAAQHPQASGITADDLRAALRDYVDLDAVGRVLQEHNRAARDAVIGPGTAPFDAVLVEAIHVFQKKCYLKPGEADGVAGESTLDSLGLVRHRLQPRTDPTFKGALEVLRKHVSKVEATSGGFRVSRWYEDFVNPSFLGHKFKIAVHPMLVRHLRMAERHLLGLPAYAGLTPVTLGRALGFTPEREPHAGGRPNPNLKGSFHGFGLAIDIRYLSNPWVAGNPGQKKNGNPRFIEVMKRATLLMRGREVTVSPQYLSSLSPQKTAAIWSELRGLSDALKSYLALARDSSALRRQVQATQKPSDIDQAVRTWQTDIAKDVESLDHKGNFNNRDGRNGFFDLPADLVVALRDHAGMAWGAVDIGGNQSGDIMHFDLRRTPLGRAVRGNAPGNSPAPGSGAAARPAKARRRPSSKPRPTRYVAPLGETLYAQIPVQSGVKASEVGIFVPNKFRATSAVDLVVYLMGHTGPCSSPGPGMSRYWDGGLAKPGQGRGEGPVLLREEVNASGKNVILVAPSLGDFSNAGKLTAAGGFDTLVDKVLAELRASSKLSVKPTSVRHIVLSGHSGGGAGLRGIVKAGDAKARRIREVWGLDCFYNAGDPAAWAAWAGAEPDPAKRKLFHYFTKGRKKDGTKASPWRNTETLEGLVQKAGLTNVELVHASGESHCTLPVAFLRKRLQGSAFLDKI